MNNQPEAAVEHSTCIRDGRLDSFQWFLDAYLKIPYINILFSFREWYDSLGFIYQDILFIITLYKKDNEDVADHLKY